MRHLLLCFLLGIILIGCAHEAGPGPDPVGGGSSALDACLERGGRLREVNAIDNVAVDAHGAIATLAVSGESQIAVGSEDGSIKLWSVDGRSGGTLGVPNRVTYDTAFAAGSPVVSALAYGPDGSWLAAGDITGVVNVRPATRDGDLVTAAFDREGEEAITAVAITADGARVASATGAYGGGIRVWTIADGASTDVLPTRLWFAKAMRFLDDGGLITAGDEYGVAMIEVRAAEAPATVTGTWLDEAPFGSVRDVDATADGARVVGAGDGFVVTLDTAAPEAPLAFAADPAHDATSIALSPDGAHFVTVGSEGSVRVWDTATAGELSRIDLPGAVAVRLDRAGGQLVVGAADGMLHLYDCE